MNERIVEGKTEREFLEWLYVSIGDDDVDYMWGLSGRIGELKAIESVNKINKLHFGCGKFQSSKEFENVGSTCGDNRLHEQEDEPNLCDKCRRIFFLAVKKHRNEFNPKFREHIKLDALSLEDGSK